MNNTVSKCASCGYPLTTAPIGEHITCPMCSTVNESISEGVTVPTGLLWTLLGFGLGLIIGPAIISSTQEGANWLSEQARRKISGK